MVANARPPGSSASSNQSRPIHPQVLPKLDATSQNHEAKAQTLDTATMKTIQANFTSATFRKLMRTMANPVVIVIPDKPLESPTEEPCGMLVASFTSITLEPEPYISFNVKCPSKTYDQILQTGKFVVLAPEESTLPAAFSEPGKKAEIIYDIMARMTSRSKPHKFALWWIHCELQRQQRLDVGDHSIIVGKVVRTSEEPGPGKTGGRMHVVLYHDGRYRRLERPSRPRGGHDVAQDHTLEQGTRDENGGQGAQKLRKIYGRNRDPKGILKELHLRYPLLREEKFRKAILADKNQPRPGLDDGRWYTELASVEET